MNEARFQVEQVHRTPEQRRETGEPLPAVSRVVVVREDRLGDVVLTLPAISALRETYPGAEICAMVRPSLASLARCVDSIDRVVSVPEDAADLTRLLRELGADLAVCVSRNARTAWSVWRAGIPHRVGSGRRVYSPLFSRCVVAGRRRSGLHELELALSFAHRAGAAGGPVHVPIAIPPDASERVRGWLAAGDVVEPYVVLHPGSGGSCPRWPLSRWTELARRLVAQGARVVVTAEETDRQVRQAFDPRAGLAGPAEVPVFSGELPALAALLDGAAWVVSNSTGPIHLAAALDTPTLALHAPWATCGVARWGPYSERGWAVVVSCPGAGEWTRRRRRDLGPRLMEALPVEFVAGWLERSGTLGSA